MHLKENKRRDYGRPHVNYGYRVKVHILPAPLPPPSSYDYVHRELRIFDVSKHQLYYLALTIKPS